MIFNAQLIKFSSESLLLRAFNGFVNHVIHTAFVGMILFKKMKINVINYNQWH